MGLGNLLRKGANLADSATAAVADAATSVKDKATGLAGDEKDEVVFDGALDMVSDGLIGSNLMSPEINAVLRAIKDSNPYK